jgi:hypothetical protein
MADLVSITAELPEIGIDAQELRKRLRKLGGVFYKRVVGMVYNEMIATAIEVTESAKDNASKYFDEPTKGSKEVTSPSQYSTGLLTQGLFHWPQPKVLQKHIVMGFGWTRRYGRVLEFGPSVTQWMIYPKYRKAIRWTASNFHGPTRSGIAGQKTMFAKSVRHKWSRDQLRPHLVPEVKRGRAKLEKRILKGLGREWRRSFG